MALVSLSTLRTRIRQRTDNEHTGNAFVTNAELNTLINASYQELYGMLVRAGLQRTESSTTIVANGTAAGYALPAGFYATLGVFRVDGTYKHPLQLVDLRYKGNTQASGVATGYRVVGSNLVLYPNAPSGSYELWYIPVPGTLSADGDTVDGVLGWEEYLVVDCSIKVLQKEESETRDLKEERELLRRRIQDEAAAVEQTQSWRVVNVKGLGVLDEGEYQDRRGYRGSLSFPLPTWRW